MLKVVYTKNKKNVNSHKILEKSMKYALMFVFNMVECVKSITGTYHVLRKNKCTY